MGGGSAVCRSTVAELLELWSAYNRHLAHVIASVPARCLANEGSVARRPVTLQFLMEDYVAHLQHHLRSILR